MDDHHIRFVAWCESNGWTCNNVVTGISMAQDVSLGLHTVDRYLKTGKANAGTIAAINRFTGRFHSAGPFDQWRERYAAYANRKAIEAQDAVVNRLEALEQQRAERVRRLLEEERRPKRRPERQFMDKETIAALGGGRG